MPKPSSDVAFTPSVKSVQERRGSRAAYARMEEKGGFETGISDDLAEFVAEPNCHQHIPRKLDGAEVEETIAALRARISALEAENARLRGG